MKIKALITTLVLGSSSLALANPSWSGGVNVQASYGGQVAIRDHRDVQPQPIVRDHRDGNRDRDRDRDGDRDDVRNIEMTLVSSAKLEKNQAESFRIEAPRGFSKLVLQRTAGTTAVQKVTIRFADGCRQVAYPNALLDARGETSTIHLTSRAPIEHITVEGSSGPYGLYSIFAA